MGVELTTRGVWLWAAAAVALGVGVAVGRPAAVFAAGAVFLAFAVAWALTVPSMLALDRRFVRLEVTSGLDAGLASSGHVVGDWIELGVRVRNDSAAPVFRLGGTPYAADALDLRGEWRIGTVAPGGEAEGQVRIGAARTGRWVLQGFDVTAEDPLGLMQIRDYLPCPCVFEFYPAAGRLVRDRRPTETGGERRGRRSDVSAGGMTVRELREYQPSDPLKRVAWKPTVRLRRLISREFESPSTRPTSILLDVSGSMRGPRSDEPKLEHALEVGAEIADAAVRRRSRVALTTFGSDVHGHLRAGRTPSHYRRLLRMLTGVRSVVDPDRTEFDDAQLADRLADYLLVQERLDFRKDDGESVDRPLLARWIESRLELEREQFATPSVGAGRIGERPSPLREFALLRGVPIPYRSLARSDPKEAGLTAAVERAAADASSPLRMIVLSDLCGIRHLDSLGDALSLAAGRGHELEFWVPFTPAYYELDEEADEADEILLELFSAAERTDRREVVEYLRDRGVDVRVLTPEDKEEG
ncbi:MAG: DUF58 domain-containing protein [Bradymonadaceae bacterium]